jgi:hypothetical protein
VFRQFDLFDSTGLNYREPVGSLSWRLREHNRDLVLLFVGLIGPAIEGAFDHASKLRSRLFVQRGATASAFQPPVPQSLLAELRAEAC